MPEANPSPAGDASQANVEAQPVEANIDGNESQSEKRFTSSDMEAVIKDRLTREQKKFAKEKAELERKLGELGKAKSPNVEDDYKQKLTAFESEKSVLAQRLDKYRNDALRGQVQKKLVEHGCIDPDLVFDAISSRGQVKFDDDDNLVVENVTNSLDDLVKDFLSTKPHLVKATVNGGIGSKGPKKPNAAGDPSQMSLEELQSRLGVQQKSKSIFSR